MKLRASEQQWTQVKRLTDLSFVRGTDSPLETGCIILFTENDHLARPSLLVSDVLAPDQKDLLHQTNGSLTFSSQYLRRALLTVRERGLKGFLRSIRTRCPIRWSVFLPMTIQTILS